MRYEWLDTENTGKKPFFSEKSGAWIRNCLLGNFVTKLQKKSIYDSLNAANVEFFLIAYKSNYFLSTCSQMGRVLGRQLGYSKYETNPSHVGST